MTRRQRGWTGTVADDRHLQDKERDVEAGKHVRLGGVRPEMRADERTPASAMQRMVKSRALLIQTMVQRGLESSCGNHVSWISVPARRDAHRPARRRTHGDGVERLHGMSMRRGASQTHHANRVGQIEACANGAAVLGAERAADHVVAAATMHVA